ncbi:hypothetical protein [Streptomyces chartreusis]
MATQHRVGALVVDTQKNKLGVVMGKEGPYVQLRPPAGGREWDADPECIRRPTEAERLVALRDRNHALNFESSGGIFP